MFKRVSLLISLLIVTSVAIPQQVPNGRTTEQNVLLSPNKQTDESMKNLCTQSQNLLSEKLQLACESLLESAINTERVTTEQRLEQAAFAASHLRLILERQAWQSLWLFWLVMSVVVIGNIAAITQFYRSIKTPSSGSLELAVSTSEFKVKTTWMGIVLLGMSMVFLVAYLVYIYPVKGIV